LVTARGTVVAPDRSAGSRAGLVTNGSLTIRVTPLNPRVYIAASQRSP
jgi:hypothetical protein